MKNLFIIKMFVISMLIFVLFVIPVGASTTVELHSSSAQTLVRLKILQGDNDGSLRLQDKIKRSEFITLIVRILGYDIDTDLGSVKVPFKDIEKNHWAYNYIRLSIKYKLVEGYPDNTIAPDNFVTYAEAQTVLIKALGYSDALDGSWPDNVINKATDLGINRNLSMPDNKQLTRGDASVLVKNSLCVSFKNN